MSQNLCAYYFAHDLKIRSLIVQRNLLYEAGSLNAEFILVCCLRRSGPGQNEIG